MKICDDLRQAVLQAAIQGKLSTQRQEDGDARDLLKQIAEEKARLIKEKKIKKEKPLLEITDDEKPFDIPDNWVWVRLGCLVENITSGSRDWAQYYTDGDGDKFIRMGNLSKSSYSMRLDKIQKVKLPDSVEGTRTSLMCGDLLFSITGDIGMLGLIPENFGKAYINQHTAMIRFMQSIRNRYIPNYLLSSVAKKYYNNNKHGIKNSFRLDILSFIPVPLPPLAEQHRIVDKVDKLMAEIDELEEVENELVAMKDAFPGDMKAALLQAAMQGKLTTQRKEDGDASDLLKQITAEKAKLIKEGKLKKEKPLAEITEDEKPFDIPENWEWVRLGALFNIVNGFTPLKSNASFWNSNDIPWFTVDDIWKQGRIIKKTELFIANKALAKNTNRILPKGTVLLCCTASIGEYAITEIELTTNQQFNGLYPKDIYKDVIYNYYLYYFVQILKRKLLSDSTSTTFNFLSLSKLSNFLFPLPPLAEQERIVAKLDKLLPLCESLKQA